MEKLEEIIRKYEIAKRPEKLKITFDEVEKLICFKLPDDYKTFASYYLEFEDFIGNEYVRLWNFEEIIEINTDYLIFEYLPKTLAIGGNGGGEFIAIEQNNDNSFRVVLSPFIDLDKQYHIEIGSSFTDFLQRLDNGQEWFK